MKNIILASKELADYLNSKKHISGEIRFLESIVKPGMKVIDVGGFYGLAALYIAKLIGDNGKLYVFEPLLEYYSGIVENFKTNHIQNTEVIQLALGNKKMEHIEFYPAGDATSMIPKPQVEPIEVPMVTLDSYCSKNKIDQIDFLNMDCEGSELKVLEGAKSVIENNDIKIFCEIHHQFLSEINESVADIVKYLEKLNYQVNSVDLATAALSRNFEACEYIYAYR